MGSGVVKFTFAAIWLALFFLLAFDAGIREGMLSFCKEHPALAPLILIITQLLLASLVLPCSPLTILAGTLWGLEFGILYSISATLIASVWTFFLGRRLLRRWCEKNMQSAWWHRVFGLVSRYKWKASLIAHVNPVFPGSSLGYIFGISTVTLSSFMLGAFLGTLPLQFMMVGIGDLTGRILSGGAGLWGLLSIFALVMLLAGYKVLVPRLLRRLDN